MSASNEQQLTQTEKRQIATVFAALTISACSVIGLTLASRRISFLRKGLRAPEWRMRAACVTAMASYKLLSRLLRQTDETPAAPDTEPSEMVPAE